MTFHSASAQDSRMLTALRAGAVTSLEASGGLDIVHPPSSIRRLRRQGYDIRTEWVYQAIEPGRPPHRVGRYVLIAEPARIAA